MRLEHIAVIMDGNGRWAQRQGLSRSEGHVAGIEALKRAVDVIYQKNIPYLTVYAFSTDNWKRPQAEVSTLMHLMKNYLQHETDSCVQKGVRINVIGRRDRLAPDIRHEIEKSEQATAAGHRLLFRFAVDYGARDVIERAAKLSKRLACKPFRALIERASHSVAGVPDVDLMIRTGGEKRLSDFLLWENAYAELYFLDGMWPDFGAQDVDQALDWYSQRKRRFGGLLTDHVAVNSA
ncbi:MAG: di-trans,poly-cis-decaprenylcistransferase [Acidobacteria bacterium]|nr:di-trans,poly-cis-decaprenylcistransferase [Acidobacteriota bacterium]